MKNLIITFLFLAIPIFCFAQTAFSEQTLLDINKRVMQDFPKFITEEASPDYTFTNGNGVILTYDQMKGMAIKITEWNLSDIKVKQVGQMAVVTGINKHSILSVKSNITAAYNMRFTYTYEYKNDKWLWLTAQHSDIAPRQTPEEEEAIKKLLDNVDAAFNSGDKDGVINAWKNDPTISFIGSGAGGEFNLVAQDYEGLKKAVTQYVVKPTGTRGIKSNHRFIFKGNIAVVEFDQEDIRANGTKGYAHNINVLEKVGDSWKVIVASHHGFNPKNEDKPEDVVKQWLNEYNKDDMAFFMDRCTEDFVASNNGGKFFGKKVFDGRKSMPHNTEASDMKSIQSGNLAIVTGIMTYHHKQPDGRDLTDKNVFTFGMVKKNGKWMYATHHFSSMVEEKPEAVLQEFLTEYHKNPKTFFESRLPEDFRYLTGGKQFETKEVVLSRSSANPTDSEVSDLKAFQSGNLGVISGVHVFKNRQADGNIQANKVAFTYTMVKKNGKWFFAESHHTPVKE